MWSTGSSNVGQFFKVRKIPAMLKRPALWQAEAINYKAKAEATKFHEAKSHKDEAIDFTISKALYANISKKICLHSMQNVSASGELCPPDALPWLCSWTLLGDFCP